MPQAGALALVLRGRLRCLLVTILIGWPALTAAQPRNDNCATPTVISTWRYTAEQDTSTATTAPSDPVHRCYNSGSTGTGHQDQDSVWYSFTPDRTGTAFVDLAGTDYIKVLGLYKGSCQALAGVTIDRVPRTLEASCSDQGSLSWPVPFSVEAGNTY